LRRFSYPLLTSQDRRRLNVAGAELLGEDANSVREFGKIGQAKQVDFGSICYGPFGGNEP